MKGLLNVSRAHVLICEGLVRNTASDVFEDWKGMTESDNVFHIEISFPDVPDGRVLVVHAPIDRLDTEALRRDIEQLLELLKIRVLRRLVEETGEANPAAGTGVWGIVSDIVHLLQAGRSDNRFTRGVDGGLGLQLHGLGSIRNDGSDLVTLAEVDCGRDGLDMTRHTSRDRVLSCSELSRTSMLVIGEIRPKKLVGLVNGAGEVEQAARSSGLGDAILGQPAHHRLVISHGEQSVDVRFIQPLTICSLAWGRKPVQRSLQLIEVTASQCN